MLLLVGIHAHGVGVLRDPLPARIHADEMRRKQNGRTGLDRLEMFDALDANQAADALGTRPPQDAALDKTAREHLEMIAQESAGALLRSSAGKHNLKLMLPILRRFAASK